MGVTSIPSSSTCLERAAVVAACSGAWLVATSPDLESRVDVTVYAASLVLLLVISAVHHRFTWLLGTRMWLLCPDPPTNWNLLTLTLVGAGLHLIAVVSIVQSWAAGPVLRSLSYRKYLICRN
jgi:predicted membrane channel-forming protein YqfA (hemolysin III family)